ncbi:MAG: hypothetical protein HY606_06205, partial [Planctomycetes bacterium]|nr:hypothetical protein [Planctomycetota bacterium]
MHVLLFFFSGVFLYAAITGWSTMSSQSNLLCRSGDELTSPKVFSMSSKIYLLCLSKTGGNSATLFINTLNNGGVGLLGQGGRGIFLSNNISVYLNGADRENRGFHAVSAVDKIFICYLTPSIPAGYALEAVLFDTTTNQIIGSIGNNGLVRIAENVDPDSYPWAAVTSAASSNSLEFAIGYSVGNRINLMTLQWSGSSLVVNPTFEADASSHRHSRPCFVIRAYSDPSNGKDLETTWFESWQNESKLVSRRIHLSPAGAFSFSGSRLEFATAAVVPESHDTYKIAKTDSTVCAVFESNAQQETRVEYALIDGGVELDNGTVFERAGSRITNPQIAVTGNILYVSATETYPSNEFKNVVIQKIETAPTSVLIPWTTTGFDIFGPNGWIVEFSLLNLLGSMPTITYVVGDGTGNIYARARRFDEDGLQLWDNVIIDNGNASGSDIYRSEGVSTGIITVNGVENLLVCFEDFSIDPGIAISGQLIAANGTIGGGPSSGSVAAPTLSAVFRNSEFDRSPQIDLTISHSSSNAVFEIEERSGSNTRTFNQSSRTYIMTSPLEATSYSYKAKATVNSVTSDWSQVSNINDLPVFRPAIQVA